MQCPECQFEIPDDSKFCKECGCYLDRISIVEKTQPLMESERKHVTILFSDLSGYTAMTERLDPEEVKEMMSHIFDKIAQIIQKYDGFIERFIGDAVMAIFGIPKVHEDDPVRAIISAREIHEAVADFSPGLRDKVGRSLAMHTGINTGLVVTGKVDIEKGTYGLTGDAINLASRLEGLAKPGEILVGKATYDQAEGFFDFEPLEPIKVKGKSEHIKVFKVLSQIDRPVKIHRLRGLQSILIDREKEMAILSKAVDGLKHGEGKIVSICGEAGTGKSRLIRDFKATLDLDQIQWREGHSYEYSRSMPFYPLIDLLSRAFRIDENASPETVRKRVESGVSTLLGKNYPGTPYIGGLFSLSNTEVEEVSPEYWKSRLYDAVQQLLEAFTAQKPSVICFEDLHWADPSFIELLIFLLRNTSSPTFFLCVFRPSFSHFNDIEINKSIFPVDEIRLQDLSANNAMKMLKSLLKSDHLPNELTVFLQQKTEGNPFYIEEVINSLIESDVLIREDKVWRLKGTITEQDIPSSIQGVLSARIDRLEDNPKRLLQEASVIGRAFFYEILRRITQINVPIHEYIKNLERLDLIRERSIDPDLEYIFKHALSQEIVYNGVLKIERRKIHERIGITIEKLFENRLPEFYETLAFHYKKGNSEDKAVDYLMRSGKKSLKRFALEESHGFYKEAFDILDKKPNKTMEDNRLIIDVIINWALVFYYYGQFKKMEQLLRSNLDIANQIDDKEKAGMYYAWFGYTLSNRDKMIESYHYLTKAVGIGKDIESKKLLGYAYTWLTWTCTDLCRFQEAISFGEQAQKISNEFPSDPYLYFKSFSGMGYTHYFTGNCTEALAVGKKLIAFGQKSSNIRSESLGYYILGYAFSAEGDFISAIEYCTKAIKKTKDPLYSQLPKVILGFSYLLNNQYEEARKPLQEFVDFSAEFGCEIAGTPAEAVLAAISMNDGNMQSNLMRIKQIQEYCLKNGRKNIYLIIEYIIGKIYLQMIMGPKPQISVILKNLGFIIKNVPFAGRMAESHFKNVIEMAGEAGTNGVLAQAYFDLGILMRLRKKYKHAKENISEAIKIFSETGAKHYLDQAEKILTSIEG